MISHVSPKITIKSVGLKGIGSIANKKIQKDEILIIQGGQIIDTAKLVEPTFSPFMNYCFQVEKDFYICPIEPKKEKMDGIFYVNHSCNPNCGFHGQITLVAMRDIKSGEELTYDYAMTDANWDNILHPEMKCVCGENNCRHIITGDDWKSEDLQKRYRGYFSAFIQRMIDKDS